MHSGDVLTLDMILDAIDLLRRSNVPKFEGHYVCTMHPRTYADLKLDEMTVNSVYRLRTLAFEILWHERWRKDIGRRPDEPTAEEAFERAWKVT